MDEREEFEHIETRGVVRRNTDKIVHILVKIEIDLERLEHLLEVVDTRVRIMSGVVLGFIISLLVLVLMLVTRIY